MDTCKHNRSKDFCCECRYGKLIILCINNKKDKCILTNKHCDFKGEDRWLCDDFIEKEHGYWMIVKK